MLISKIGLYLCSSQLAPPETSPEIGTDAVESDPKFLSSSKLFCTPTPLIEVLLQTKG